MELRDLRYFCMTAEMEHVTKAADKLSISQPFLTKIIGQIEAEVGTELFQKVGRTIKLNSFGEVFYSQAKIVLGDMENLFTEMDFALERKARSITFLCNTEAYTSRLIVEFQKLNPSFTLRFAYASKQEMIEAITNGSADFALCSPPIDDELYPHIKTEIALHDIGVVLLPPGHPLLSKKSLTFADLKGMPLVTNTKGSAMRTKLDSLFEKHNFHPQIVCESYNLNLIFQAVASGVGYAFITQLVVDDHPELKPCCVEVDMPEKRGYFGLSYNKRNENNRNVKYFRSFALSFLQGLQESLYQ